MQPGESLDLDVTDVAHGGVFVARHEGRVVFVEGAIPGERVRAELTDASKASFWRADIVDVLDASPHRRPHVWAAADVSVAPADRPGGADFGHIDLAEQRVLKKRVLDDALVRFGGIAEPVTTISPAGKPGEEDPGALGWRTRVSLHVDDKLRTILWGWAGDPLTDDERAILAVARGIAAPVAPGLADEEWEALRARADAILAAGAFPVPSGRWPSIPWPPL